MNIRTLLIFALLSVISINGYAQKPVEQSEYGNPYRKDPLVRSYITPARIIWMSDETGKNVINPDVLLQDFSGQVAVSSRENFVLSTKDGGEAAILLDFGKEYQGGIQLAAAIRGDQNSMNVRVRFGESVSEAMSDVYTSTATNEHSLRDFTMAVPWLGTVETGESGFRFVRIDLLEENAELPLSAVRLTFRHRDLPYLGSFKSDNDRLNKIWETGAYTVHLNMLDYLVEGAKRDRLVWLGDLHPEVMTVNTVFDAPELINKTLDFGREDTPLPNWMNGMLSYSLWWIIIQKDHYLYRGNYDYLKQQQAYLNGLVDQVIPMIENGRENLQGAGRFLDWPTSEMPDVIHAGLQALALMAMDAAGQIGDWLGDAQLSSKCKTVVEQMKNYTPAHLNNKQAASLLSIAGLLDPEEASGVVMSGGANGFSTFYGYYMLEALAKTGNYADAMKIMSDYWGAMLDLGATTFWEDLKYSDVANAGRIDEIVPEGKFDIHADGGAYCYIGLRHSFCHGWASGPTIWLTRHVLGIYPVEPGFKKVRIEPNLGDLKWAEGSIPTPYGVITVKHTKQSYGKIKSEVKLPKGVKIVK